MSPLLQGSRVFIGLRTGIFKDFSKGEHITVEFLGSFPEWSRVQKRLEYWKDQLGPFPLRVEVEGYANYTSGDRRYFQVAMMRFPELGTDINYSKFWHLTMGKQDTPFKEARAFDPDVDAFNNEVCDDLWIGYKDEDNNLKWSPYHTRPSHNWSKSIETPF